MNNNSVSKESDFRQELAKKRKRAEKQSREKAVKERKKFFGL